MADEQKQTEDKDSETPPTTAETVSGESKSKKPYKWTPAREAAFIKMRESLAEKNEATKQIRKEKQKADREEIKKRVKQIMQTSKQGAAMEKEESSSASSDSSSESEQEIRHKKKSKSKVAPPVLKHSEKKDRVKKRAISSSESSNSEESDSSEEEEPIVQERYAASKRGVDKYRQNKVQLGKTSKTSLALNPLDRFILL